MCFVPQIVGGTSVCVDEFGLNVRMPFEIAMLLYVFIFFFFLFFARFA